MESEVAETPAPSNQRDQGLLEELTCPVCKEYMLPPIRTCLSNHSICEHCRNRLTACPICNVFFGPIRNTQLEERTKSLQYPCSYEDFGCNELFPVDKIFRHRKNCYYKQFVCFLRENINQQCSWFGRRDEVKAHYMNRHPQFSTKLTEKGVRFPLEIGPEDAVRLLALAFNETFCIHIETNGSCLFFSVQLAGPKDSASKFRFELSLQDRRTRQKISYLLKVQDMDAHIEDLQEIGLCVIITFESLITFTDEAGVTFFEFNIHRI